MKDLSWRILTFIQVIILAAAVTFSFTWSRGVPSGIKVHDDVIYYDEMNQSDKHTVEKIKSVDDWISFSEAVSAGKDYSDTEVILTEDLDFSGYTINPVGSYIKPFQGTFDGNGHIIYNLNLSLNDNYVGLFAVARFAEIRNLTLKDCHIQSDEAIGTGGLVGLAGNCEISQCEFNGIVFGKSGSVGGIIGNNWSLIRNCRVHGTVIGSTQGGAYGASDYLQLQGNSFGTGGISGDNGNVIYLCENYADISDDTDEHESNTSRSGGIAGCNSGTIDSCINRGSATGGGITENNRSFGKIRCCFNYGDVYSGIALGSYRESHIEYCVNLGVASGRYAGDIVSFWGQSSEDNVNGMISNCLYVDSAGAGVARHHYFGIASLKNNAKIKLSKDSRSIIDNFIANEEYDEAYNFLIKQEKERRRTVSITIIGTILLIIVVSNGLLWARRNLRKANIYKRGIKCFENKEYWESYRFLSEISDYKDSLQIINAAINAVFNGNHEGDIVQFGSYNGEKLYWMKISDEEGTVGYISIKALFVSPICETPEIEQWESTKLYIDLNSIYKQQWFGEVIDKHMGIELTLPNANSILNAFPTNEQRKCKGLLSMEGALKSGGNVYWWLIDERKTGYMPFVTADGLISERGKTITSDNIAVRPLIIIKENI